MFRALEMSCVLMSDGSTPSSSSFPEMPLMPHLHQECERARSFLANVLHGFAYPLDPEHFKSALHHQVDSLFRCLRDPALPLHQLLVRTCLLNHLYCKYEYEYVRCMYVVRTVQYIRVLVQAAQFAMN